MKRTAAGRVREREGNIERERGLECPNDSERTNKRQREQKGAGGLWKAIEQREGNGGGTPSAEGSLSLPPRSAPAAGACGAGAYRVALAAWRAGGCVEGGVEWPGPLAVGREEENERTRRAKKGVQRGAGGGGQKGARTHGYREERGGGWAEEERDKGEEEGRKSEGREGREDGGSE